MKKLVYLTCTLLIFVFITINGQNPVIGNPVTGTSDYKITGGFLQVYGTASSITIGGVNTGATGGSVNIQSGNGMTYGGSITLALPSQASNPGNIYFLLPNGSLKIGTALNALPLTISGNGSISTSGTITSGAITGGAIKGTSFDAQNGIIQTTGAIKGVSATIGTATINATGDISANSLTTSGNVAIATTTQRAGCALTVNGKIAAEEFEIVTNVNVPDYVFGKNYKLRSLNDLENYINTNNHLPETPSAKDIEKNGYKVVEMDNLLLKKVEELSLYVIELNKQLEAAKTELEKVKSEKQ